MAALRRQTPYTPTAPVRQGIYSQAVVVDRTVYVSGQLGLDVASGQLVDGGVQAQAKQLEKTILMMILMMVVMVKNVFVGTDDDPHVSPAIISMALINMGEILKAAGCTYNNVVKTTVLLADINDFNRVNEVYRTFFSRDFPARAAYQVAALPRGGLVEIEAVAVVGPLSDP
ncbi:2-iminobutanoate/2-iminopropanoate deaminase [Takifugu flavidus]|uniref:2-iminobutanoate/2-iminopropanoate deaminase n=1 Tax=Takifugu flavidus TaxID=433684 RepID=A0A5C6NI09_9TELE|nr:2-iminobutanoate/2-iminopropanoate deaminase [Takifugu flavidus]